MTLNILSDSSSRTLQNVKLLRVTQLDICMRYNFFILNTCNIAFCFVCALVCSFIRFSPPKKLPLLTNTTNLFLLKSPTLASSNKQATTTNNNHHILNSTNTTNCALSSRLLVLRCVSFVCKSTACSQTHSRTGKYDRRGIKGRMVDQIVSFSFRASICYLHNRPILKKYSKCSNW